MVALVRLGHVKQYSIRSGNTLGCGWWGVLQKLSSFLSVISNLCGDRAIPAPVARDFKQMTPYSSAVVINLYHPHIILRCDISKMLLHFPDYAVACRGCC